MVAPVLLQPGESITISAAVAVPPPPPPPPAASFHSTITDAAVLVGIVPWLVVMDSGIADHIDFIVDGVVFWPEKAAPWGGDFDTKPLANGAHTFTVKVFSAANALLASDDADVIVSNVIVVPPPPPPVSTLVIASGVASTKDNWRISRNAHGDLSMRFRKKGTGPITGVAWQQRIGANYSLGDGGLYRASIQMDVAGKPSGTILAAGTFTFNMARAADAYFEPWMFTAPTIPIQDGALCHFVLENIHSNHASNYISLNALFMWGDNVGSQRQPAFPDSDLALLSNVGSGWGESNETPNFDVLPNHEGFGYTQCNIEMWKKISGSLMVRQTFGAPAITLHEMMARVRRTSGSSPLTLIYETQAGSLIAKGNVPASSIPQSSPGGDNGGQARAIFTLPAPVVAPAGMNALRLTCPADTVYTVAPIRKAVKDNTKSAPDWGSYMIALPGRGEFSTDNGVSWASIYKSVNDQEDLQFYIK